MPSIHNQDWLPIVKVPYGRSGTYRCYDANYIGNLIKALLLGNLRDFTYIDVSSPSSQADTFSYILNLSIRRDGGIVVTGGGPSYNVLGEYMKPELYFALSAIQLAQDGIKGSPMTELPTLGKKSNLFLVKNSVAQAVIATGDGFAYNVTASAGKITGISRSEITAEEAKSALSIDNVIVISEEEAANLVGYVITDLD